MKKFLSVCMCFFILTISIITYMPVFSYAADNDFTLSITYDTAVSNSPSLAASEAHDAVMNHGDIYGSDHKLLFQYSPTSTYNWVFADSKTGIKMSDVQLEKFLQCSNALTHLARLYTANASNNTLVRTMMGAVGVIANGDSELLTNFYDELTGNVNYLNAIEYDPQTGDLTLLADQVTALRNELKDIYYDSLGLFILRSEGTPQSLLSSAKYLYEHEEDFQSDYVDIQNRDYVFSCMAYNGLRMVVRYVFSDTPSYFYWNGKDSYCEGSNLVVMNSNFDILTMDYVSYYSSCEPKNISFRNNVPLHKSDLIINNGSYFSGLVHYYSDTNEPIKIWSSYEALYNYLHGSQNAYLSSKVEEAGEDIKLSINDLNENIGSKMDELIDSINNKKDGMSADELQKAIDNALNSISGKIDDIEDNTQQTNNKLDALLESVSGTNQILMQILGVTTDIRDIVKTQNEEGNDYTMNDVQNCFNTMMEKVKNAILYGDNSDSSGSDSSSSKLASSYSSDIAVYSVDNLNYENGILGKFPFSVPYQLYEWLQVLQSDEKTPSFNYNYGFLIGKKSDGNYNLTFDLSEYQPWADVVKSFLRLSFTLIFAVCIYNKFKGEI